LSKLFDKHAAARGKISQIAVSVTVSAANNVAFGFCRCGFGCLVS
jgi:hypothetical protein